MGRRSSFDQCRLQLMQFLVHLVDFATVGLRCDGSDWFQKVIVNPASRQPPHCLIVFLWWSFGFQKCLGGLVRRHVVPEMGGIVFGYRAGHSFHLISRHDPKTARSDSEETKEEQISKHDKFWQPHNSGITLVLGGLQHGRYRQRFLTLYLPDARSSSSPHFVLFSAPAKLCFRIQLRPCAICGHKHT